MNEIKTLSEDQKYLLSLVAEDSVQAWNNPGNSRISTATRVLLRTLIRRDEPEDINLVRNFYNTKLPSQSRATTDGVHTVKIPFEGKDEVIVFKIVKAED